MNPIVKTNKINKMTNNGIMLLLIILIIGIVTTSPIWSSNQIPNSNYNVRQFKATGDGNTYDTKSIQNAIDSCHEGGGGVVYFPPGKYLVGTLFLKSNVTLYLEVNATLLGSKIVEDFDPPYLIYSKDSENVGIIGQGIIDGQGEFYWQGKKRPFIRPEFMIFFEYCQNILIEGITIKNSPHMTIFPYGCDRININGINILNDLKAPNADGINIVCSSNVFINNCYIQGGDDCICLKSIPLGSITTLKPTENVTVTNCVIVSDDAGIKLGTESYGDIRHCVFNNIVIRNTQDGIALYMKDGGHYETIHFSNITIESDDVRKMTNRDSGFPIFIDIDQRTDTSKVGSIRNIVFSNINIDTGMDNCLIQGTSDHPLENITFDNVRMKILSSADHSKRKKSGGSRDVIPSSVDYAYVPAHFTFANLNGLTIRNLYLNDNTKKSYRERHAIGLINTSHVSVEGLRGTQIVQEGKRSSIYLKDSKDVLIEGCRAIPGKISFLRLEGIGCETVSVIGNDLSEVKKPFDFGDDFIEKTLFQAANRLP
jgi:polygalacturonase